MKEEHAEKIINLLSGILDELKALNGHINVSKEQVDKERQNYMTQLYQALGPLANCMSALNGEKKNG
jgi:hypothetical protein